MTQKLATGFGLKAGAMVVLVIASIALISLSPIFVFFVSPPLFVFLAYRYLYLLPKLSKVKNSNVVFIHDWQAYAVLLEAIERNQRLIIKAVRPQLQNNYIEFIEISCGVDGFRLVNKVKNFNLDLKIMEQVSVPVQELYHQIEPKLLELEQQVENLKRIEHLTRSSDMYSEKTKLYSRARSQVSHLLKEGNMLRNECLRLLREILVGAEVSKFEPGTLPDMITWKLEFQEKYRVISEKYQALHDEVTTLVDLRGEHSAPL